MDPNLSRNQNTDTPASDDMQDVQSESLGMAGGLGMSFDDTPKPIPSTPTAPISDTPADTSVPAAPTTPQSNTLPQQTFGDTFTEGKESAPTAPAPLTATPQAPTTQPSSTSNIDALQEQAKALQAQLAQLNSAITGMQGTPAEVQSPQTPQVAPEPTVPPQPEVPQETPTIAEQLQATPKSEEPNRPLTPFEELKQLRQQAAQEDVSEPLVESAPEATDTPEVEEELREAVSDPIAPTEPLAQPEATAAQPIQPVTEPVVPLQPEPVVEAQPIQSEQLAQIPPTEPTEIPPTGETPESSTLQPVRTFHADAARAQGTVPSEPEITPAPAPGNPKPANPVDLGTSRTPAELQMNETISQLQTMKSVQPDMPNPMPQGPSRGLENLNALKSRMDYESTHKGDQPEPDGVRDMLDISQPPAAPPPPPPQPVTPPAAPPQPQATPIEPAPIAEAPAVIPITQEQKIAQPEVALPVNTPIETQPTATIIEQHEVANVTPAPAQTIAADAGKGRPFFDKLNTLRGDGTGQAAPDGVAAALTGVAAPANSGTTPNVPVGFEAKPQPSAQVGVKPKSMDELLNQATGTPTPQPMAQTPVPQAAPPGGTPTQQPAVTPQASTQPSTQPGGAPFSPQNPPGPGTAKLRPVRTFKDDLEQTVQRKNTSFVNIVSAEQNRKAQTAHQQERPKPIKKGPNSLMIVAGSGLLVGVGVAALVFAFYLYTKTPEAVPVVSVPEYIFTNDQQPVDLSNADSTNLLRLLETAKDGTSLELGEISHLYLVKQNLISGNQVTENITPEEFFTLLDSRAPSGMIRSLDSFMMYGTHFFAGGNQPFFIFKTDSYDFAFGGMLAWEPDMNEDLSPLFGPIVRSIVTQPIVVSTNTASSTDAETASTTNNISTIVTDQGPTEHQFEDDIIRNQDVRVLRNQDGEIVLLYGFPDASTLVITTNEHTFAEIATRLSSRRF